VLGDVGEGPCAGAARSSDDDLVGGGAEFGVGEGDAEVGERGRQRRGGGSAGAGGGGDATG
jgi:hypothetical protein